MVWTEACLSAQLWRCCELFLNVCLQPHLPGADLFIMGLQKGNGNGGSQSLTVTPGEMNRNWYLTAGEGFWEDISIALSQQLFLFLPLFFHPLISGEGVPMLSSSIFSNYIIISQMTISLPSWIFLPATIKLAQVLYNLSTWLPFREMTRKLKAMNIEAAFAQDR